MAKNIEMNNLNESGSYEIVYPKTLAQISVVSDNVANSFSMNKGANVDDILDDISQRFIMIQNNVGRVVLTVTDTDGKPIKGVLITNLSDINGNAVYTDNNGKAVGFGTTGNVTPKITGYADLTDVSTTLTIGAGETTYATMSTSRVNFRKWTASTTTKFSPAVYRVDVTAVGGGGGGASKADSYCSSGGGAGGRCIVQESVPFSTNTSLTVTVGGGGTASNDGTIVYGGTSSFLNISAKGGASANYSYDINWSGQMGATDGNGAGGNGWTNHSSNTNPSTYYTTASGKAGNAGGNGTVYGYSSFTETVLYGGGGGSGGAWFNGTYTSYAGGAGGKGYGGAGGKAATTSYQETDIGDGAQGVDGFGGGGGGGGFCKVENINTWQGFRHGAGGKGGSGCIAIRIHYES